MHATKLRVFDSNDAVSMRLLIVAAKSSYQVPDGPVEVSSDLISYLLSLISLISVVCVPQVSVMYWGTLLVLLVHGDWSACFTGLLEVLLSLSLLLRMGISSDIVRSCCLAFANLDETF